MIRIVGQAWDGPLGFWRLLCAVWGQMAVGFACGTAPMLVLPLAAWLVGGGAPR